MPAQGLRPPLVFCVTACVVALIRAAGAQDAQPVRESLREPWPLAAQQELPRPGVEAEPTASELEASRPDAAESTTPDVEIEASQPGAAEPATPVVAVEASEPDAGPAIGGDDAQANAASASQPNADRASAGGPDLAPAFPVLENAPAGVGNDDVRAMTEAQFSENTILAAIGANATRFDVSPRALVGLKSAGVSEKVIEAMLAAETAKKQPAAAPLPPPVSEPAAPQGSEEFAKLSAMIDRLAAQQEAAETARRAPDPPKSSDSSPRAWILNAADKTAIAPTIAQVAFTDEKTSVRLKTLQGLAGKALAFASPAASGIASTLGGLFRSDTEHRTAVWALSGISAARDVAGHAAFEIDYGRTPGVDPDAYHPAIVQLVRTTDNYRLVAAAKTEGTKTVATTQDPIVEELVPTELNRIERGHYRVQTKEALAPGEYALVLRPIVKAERRRKSSDASLGELLGGTSQILYLTWDFYVAAQ